MNVREIVGWRMTNGHHNLKWGEGGICKKTDIELCIVCNNFCLGRSVMDKFVVRTPRVAPGATGEIFQYIESAPQKRSQ